MKRLLIVLFILGLFVAACGSPEEVELSSAEIDSTGENASIETRVAATVAAALGQSAPTAATEPAISGDATPLTPIPQLVEPLAEVSPEVEYAEPGQDGELTFDFGGGATATSQVAATQTAVPQPTRARTTAVGGTVFFVQDTVALTLKNARFVESYVDTQGVERSTREGYRLLVLTIEGRNASPTIVSASNLEGYVLSLFRNYDLFVLDRDDDPFTCANTSQLDQFEKSGLYLPGYGFGLEMVCEIPVTAAADELNGLRLVSSGAAYGDEPFEFDLGSSDGIPADLSNIETSYPTYTLPISNNEICAAESDATYVIESATWYDAPTTGPADYQIQQITERYLRERNDSGVAYMGNGTVSSVEEAEALLTTQWQPIWTNYDFTIDDLVAIRITRTNNSKQDMPGQIGDFTFWYIDPQWSVSAKWIVKSINRAERLIDPLYFLNDDLPPGTENTATIYAIVPENQENVRLLHQAPCEDGSTKEVILDLPRAAYSTSDESINVSEIGQLSAGNDSIAISATAAMMTASATTPAAWLSWFRSNSRGSGKLLFSRRVDNWKVKL